MNRKSCGCLSNHTRLSSVCWTACFLLATICDMVEPIEPIEFKPRGVQLRDPDDFDAQRQEIADKALSAVRYAFPKVYNGVRLEVDNLNYGPEPDLGPAAMTKALLRDKYVTRQLKGTLRLFDDKTGDLLDSRENQTVMNVPWLSPRGTFVHRGNHYTSASQMRLMAGPYGRVMSNGNIEMHANMKPGTGTSWRVMLEPESGQFRLRVGPSAGLHLYSLWKDLGVEDEKIKGAWGEGTWQRNAGEYNPRTLGMAYKRLVPPRLQVANASSDEQRKAVLEALNKGTVLASVAKRNLPHFFSREKAASMQRMMESTTDDLHRLFKPDLSPGEMQDSYASIYGRHGPRLASMKEWPASWIDHETDPMGWMEWYMNYSGGRRTAGDLKQIRRWLRVKRMHGQAYAKNPTPRRGFALRNWAIDPLKLVEEEQREEAAAAMRTYKDEAWADWASKKASLELGDLQAIARHLNECSKAGIDVEGTYEQLETAIRSHLFTADRSDMAWQNAAMAVKAASFVGLLVTANPEAYTTSWEHDEVVIEHGGMTFQL